LGIYLLHEGVAMIILGFVIILSVFVAYFAMLFVFHRFTYKTWIFDSGVVIGMALAAANWLQAGGSWLTWSTIALGVIWFVVSRTELRIIGSKELNLHVGDTVPAMTFMRTDGTQFTEQDLIANAPALLALYRGWWCPSSKLQLGEIMEHYEYLNEKGVSLYAASVDEPALASPIQEHVGNKITILCGVSEAVLKKVGVLDTKGAPWYDRLIFGAPERPISMPAILVIDKDGSIIFVSRSTQVDDRPWTNEILTRIASLP
jgi:peroxiredoxin